MTHTLNEDEGELSFGVELEFLFYFKVPGLTELIEDDEDDEGVYRAPTEFTIDAAEEAQLPPALVLPPEYTFYEEGREPDDVPEAVTARGWATTLLQQAILSVPGARLEGRPMPAGVGTPASPFEAMYAVPDHTDDHSGWWVKDDASVRDPDVQIRGYRALGFEVTSPALWDRPASHRHVYRVVQELVRRFRLRVNIHTGFHVHVGVGFGTPNDDDDDDDGDDGDDDKEGLGLSPAPPVEGLADLGVKGKKLGLGVLKRAAALMWAADGFLSHAHPPERGMNYYLPPIRFCSRLAYGVQAYEAHDAEGNVTLQERPLGTDSYVYPPGAFVAPANRELLLVEQDRLPSSRLPRLDRDRLFPALRTEALDKEAEKRFRSMWQGKSVKSAKDIRNQTVYSGVGHIMGCKSRSEVALLFGASQGSRHHYHRTNYNLRAYLTGNFATPEPSTGTVEFREASGTMSPAWVAAWSSVCLGVVRFARDASDARFWAVIAELAMAEAAAIHEAPRGNHRYDMISLLYDMGLFAEGLFLESKLRQDPMRFWYPNRLGVKEKKSSFADIWDPDYGMELDY